MEELEPQELEELVQELEGEYGTQEPLPPDVEEFLRVLQSGGAALDRRDAAEKLGEVGTSNPRIVCALIAAYESDSYSMVSRAAAESLRAPVHQEYLGQHPDLMEEVERALRQGSGVDKQSSLSDTISMQLDEEDVDSFLSRVFHDPRWKWAPVYAVFLLVTTALVLVVDGFWTLLPAGVVWFAGSVLGLLILQRKGHPVSGFLFGLLDLGDDLPGGCALAFLALFALAGPAILLGALFIRPRGSIAIMSKRRRKAKAADRRRPAAERNRPSGCPACGAWNEPGSEICDECGLALDGVAA